MKLKLKLPSGKIPEQREFTGEERQIVFRHGRAPGDNIMFSAGIRDFCLLFPNIRVGVDKKYQWIWKANPYIDHGLSKNDEGVEYYKVGYPAVGACNNTYLHFTHMFLLDMIAITDLHMKLPISLGEYAAAFGNGDVGDPRQTKGHFDAIQAKYKGFCKDFSRQRGDLHLSDKEKKNNLIRDVYGYDKYWVVAPGGKRDFPAKMWDWRRFQRVIDYYDGLVKFVVIGRSDLLMEKLRGVIDLTDKFNGNKMRGLVPLVYHAEGCVSTPSLLMHMAAAVPKRKINGREADKPCVTIFGGREPTTWSWYCSHQVLHSNGAYTCCSYGGCWKSRTFPIQKNPEKNTSLCHKPIKVDGRTIQSCMDGVTTEDVIRAIGKYYEGDMYEYLDKRERTPIVVEPAPTVTAPLLQAAAPDNRRINLLGNLNSKGGGEQSLCKIAQVLMDAGWDVALYPWGSVHQQYRDNGLPIQEISFESGKMADIDRPGIPLLFYANDCTRGFVDYGQPLVDISSDVIIGINYVNRPLPDCRWLSASDKVRAFVFQNEEKRAEFERDRVGFENAKQVVLFGAIDLDAFLEVCPPTRDKNDPLVALKHCVGDYRKFVTKDSKGKGDKIHIWQKHFAKEEDTRFYARLLKAMGNEVRFEFMEGHKELVKHFKGEERMVFHEWNSMPVTEFLARGHVYLYRTSNLWRDQYPRVVAEALAAGLPVLTEPRDGTRDRVVHGNTGFYCTHYDEFQLALKTLRRKEKLRHAMGSYAKDFARMNLDPRRWVDTIEEVLEHGVP